MSESREALEAAIDAEIAAAAAGGAVEIEPWENRLARCSDPVRQMLEIATLVAAECGEDEEPAEEPLKSAAFSEDAEKEARIRRYEMDVDLDRLIQFIPANVRLA